MVEVMKGKVAFICTSTISRHEGWWVFVYPAPLWSDEDGMNTAYITESKLISGMIVFLMDLCHKSGLSAYVDKLCG
jgi:hypothetical protein